MHTTLIDGLTQWPETISDEKRNYILQLIYSNTSNDDREKWLDYLESASSVNDADDIAESLLKIHI
jgi:hypothetical protein